MQKYALKTFDMFFVVSWNEFLTHLAINPMLQKKMQMQKLPSPIHKYAKIIIMIKNHYYLINIFNILCRYIKLHIIYKKFFFIDTVYTF
jgi:hypothetical protein